MKPNVSDAKIAKDTALAIFESVSDSELQKPINRIISHSYAL